MTGDTIMMYEDHADEIEPTIHLRGTLDYMQFLAHYWMQTFGWELPEVPDEPGQNVRAVVNHGRWIAGCGGCYSGLPLSRNYTVTICPRCGSGGWARVVYPDNRDEIERELLKQPGRRLFAPFRNWVPSWSIEYLQERTEAAKRQLREGVANPRSASIGTPRIWSVGEILTASNMNTYLSEIDRDLIGINGAIELLHGVRPGTFTTAQIAALSGIPDGTLVYNQTLQNIQLMIGDSARAMVPSHVSDRFAAGEVVTVTHGLGVAPTRFQLAYERIGSSAEHGFNTDDRVYVGEGGVRPGWTVFDVDASEYKAALIGDRTPFFWAVSDTNNQLWKINPFDPDQTTGDFGNQGTFNASLTQPNGVVVHNGELFVVDDHVDELWKIDPNDPDRTDGGFGNQGTLPASVSSPSGIASYDGALWVVDDANHLIKIDPSNPGSTTGDFGTAEDVATQAGQGTLEGITYFDGAFWILQATASNDGYLLRIDPDDPDRTTGGYGPQGALPSGVTGPDAIVGYDGALWVVDGTNLWRINPDSPSDDTGDYGNQGAVAASQNFLGLGLDFSDTVSKAYVTAKTGDLAGFQAEIEVDNDASEGGWAARMLAFA